MAKPSNNDLLIIGQTFKTVAGEFEILRRLGQGATGEVYQARSLDGKRAVAIKMMRPTDMPLARKLFIGEGPILLDMRKTEEAAGDGFFVAPEYFGGDDQADIPYIVEEFMTGKPFPDLVSGGPLSEEEVVAIGRQLFRTLHLLSNGLNKNYIDLKFENLWWDQEKKILKITDWGTLEDTSSAGQARDILRASLYIYRLATGRPITESRGVLNQAVGADAFRKAWEQLSWGLQEILRRLLHPTPSARVGDDLLPLDSAEKIAQAFKNLDEYWQEPEDDLLADIRQEVDVAQKANQEKDIESQTRHYRLARTALEIASRREIPNKEYDRLRATVVDESDYYTRAHNLYEGTSYAPARKLFQIGARLLSSSKLRRWAWLAYAGELAHEKNYNPVKVYAERGVELMEQEQYRDASVSLDAALKTLPSEALQTLRWECEALNLIQQAKIAQRDGNYISAEASYRFAYEIWIKTDDHEAWKDQVGDLSRQIDIVHWRGESQEKINASLEKAGTANELAIILDELYKALALDPGNQAVYALAKKLAGERFDSGLLEDAAQILWACGIAPATPVDFMDWHCPEEIRLALDAKGRLGNASFYVTAIRIDKEALPYKLALALFEKHFIPSNDVFGVERDDAIADLVRVLDSERGKKMKEKVTDKRKEISRAKTEKINQLIAEADGLLFADSPGALQGLSIRQAFALLQNRLQGVEKAQGLLDQASRLVESNDEAIKSKLEELKQKCAALKDEFGRSSSKNEKQKEEAIAAFRGKAEGILAQLGNLEDSSPKLLKAGVPAQISDGLSGFQAELLGEVDELCAQVLELDLENKWALQTKQKVEGKMRELGDDYAALGMASHKNVLGAVVGALLDEARDFYHNRRVLEAARSLRKIEALDAQASSRQPFTGLKAKVTILLGLKYWEQENKARLEEAEFAPQLLERIASHFSDEIPPEFRKDSVSLKYLPAVRSKLFDQLSKGNPVNSSPEFAETLRNLVWTDNLYRRGQAWQNNQKINQKNGKWESEKFVVNVLNAYKKAKLGQEMEKMLARLPIFPDPQARSGELSPDVVAQKVKEIWHLPSPPPPIDESKQIQTTGAPHQTQNMREIFRNLLGLPIKKQGETPPSAKPTSSLPVALQPDMPVSIEKPKEPEISKPEDSQAVPAAEAQTPRVSHPRASVPAKSQGVWLKWILTGIGSLVLIGVLVLALIIIILNWGYIVGAVTSGGPVQVDAATTATPTATPTLIPTAILTATSTVTATPTATPTQGLVSTQFCSASQGDVFLYPNPPSEIGGKTVKLSQSKCPSFDAWMDSAPYKGWFRLALGQDPDLAGWWVMGNRLSLPPNESWKNILLKVVPTPSS
jgi:hypothetical protein